MRRMITNLALLLLVCALLASLGAPGAATATLPANTSIASWQTTQPIPAQRVAPMGAPQGLSLFDPWRMSDVTAQAEAIVKPAGLPQAGKAGRIVHT